MEGHWDAIDARATTRDLRRDTVTGPGAIMTTFKALFRLILLPACWISFGAQARAADITGVWVSDAALCAKIFVKRGNGVFLSKDADLYGSGFVIDGRKIRGKLANCNIKTTKEDGALVHLLAACATDVMLSNFQLTLRVVDQNKIIRIFPGVSDMEMGYERCDLK
jgi:hypothetical protein